MSHSQFQSKADAQVKLPEQQTKGSLGLAGSTKGSLGLAGSADGHPIPAGMVLGACVEAVAIHCERATSRRRIYLHIMDHCRMVDQHDALAYGDGLDPLYDMLLTASKVARQALDDNIQRIVDEDDFGAGDHPYQIAKQTVDISNLVGT